MIDRYPDRFRLVGLAAGARRLEREAAVTTQAGDPDHEARLEEMVTRPDVELVVVAIPGARALPPTLAALRAGKTVCLATKEVLVMAGELVMREARHRLRPIDSEHSAIWQCLWGEHPHNVSRLVLTASGGPFWARPDLDFDSVTPEQALKHPRWAMGPKVTVDSATLMNKGLELIEAHHLFGVPLERIEVVVHPQSIVHSLVEFVDGSTKAQLGNPDMRLPIAVALAYPERLPGVVPAADPIAIGTLDFHPLDRARFPAPGLARWAAERGGGAPAVLNAVNEEAVAAFLDGRLTLGGIVRAVERALEDYGGGAETLEELLEADRWARAHFAELAGKLPT